SISRSLRIKKMLSCRQLAATGDIHPPQFHLPKMRSRLSSRSTSETGLDTWRNGIAGCNGLDQFGRKKAPILFSTSHAQSAARIPICPEQTKRLRKHWPTPRL